MTKHLILQYRQILYRNRKRKKIWIKFKKYYFFLPFQQFNLLVFLWGRIHRLSMSNRLERMLERTLQTWRHLRWWYRPVSLPLSARFHWWILYPTDDRRKCNWTDWNLLMKVTTVKSILTNANQILARMAQRARTGTTGIVAAVCLATKANFARWTSPFADIRTTMTPAAAMLFCRLPVAMEPVASKAPV